MNPPEKVCTAAKSSVPGMKLERRRETAVVEASTPSPVRAWLDLRYESRLEGAVLAEARRGVIAGWIVLGMERRGGGRSCAKLSALGVRFKEASSFAGIPLFGAGTTTAAVDVAFGITTEACFEVIVPTAVICLKCADRLDPRQPWSTSRTP